MIKKQHNATFYIYIYIYNIVSTRDTLNFILSTLKYT